MAYETIQQFTSAFEAAKGAMVGGGQKDVGWAIYSRTKANPLGLCVLGRHINEQYDIQRPKRSKWAPAPTDQIKLDKPAHLKKIGEDGLPVVDNFPTTEIKNPESRAGIQWFGPGGLRMDDSIATGVSGADDYVAQNFGLVAETGDKFIGSILSASEWDLRINDCWLLGGVNGKLPFYCASKLTVDNLIDTNYALTITGREVAGLIKFGYRKESGSEMHTGGSVGDVFVSGNHSSATGATFSKYNDLIYNKINTVGAAKLFFSSRGFI